MSDHYSFFEEEESKFPLTYGFRRWNRVGGIVVEFREFLAHETLRECVRSSPPVSVVYVALRNLTINPWKMHYHVPQFKLRGLMGSLFS
jgi:hypothetical protein